MKRPIRSLAAVALIAAAVARADEVSSLEPVSVYSPSIANQSPAGTFAMPVSALRYEPLADIEPRNMAEAQADVTVRGDTFESTGFKLGAFSIFDPQTGHYLTELPVAPRMLGSPSVLAGPELASQVLNATGGAVSYDWRPVSNGGYASFSLGDDGLQREELYEGSAGKGSSHLGADADWAHASGNGTVDFGDFHFDRACARAEWVGGASRTDLFAGYQASFFGWPNLYTPFNFDETENLQTVLLAADTQADLGGGSRFEAGAFYRRNKDDYAFDRFAPLGSVHPYQHTTWEYGVGAGGRAQQGSLWVDYHLDGMSDALQSTSLVFGPYHSRALGKLSAVPGAGWDLDDGRVTVEAGATLDGSDRTGPAWSPVAEVDRTWKTGALGRLYAGFAGATQLPSYTALDSSPTGGLFRGNPLLGRETSRDTEAGASGQWSGWTWQADLFYRRDDNLVDWTYNPSVFGRSANPVNLGTAGFEAVVRRTWRDLGVVIGCTVLSKTSDYLGAPETASFYALNYARQKVTAALVWDPVQSVEMRLDNAYRNQAPDALRSQGGDRALTSALGVGWRPAAARRLELYVQVDNLWNSAFQAVPGVPASRRQLSFGATCGW